VSMPAVCVEGLSKRYKLGKVRERYPTLRNALSRGAIRSVQRIARIGRPKPPGTGKDYIWALDDVSFSIQEGEVMGIVGRNGAGKSTLLKILARITEPTRGTAKIHGRVASLLEVGTGFHMELTGRENIFLNGSILGMKRAEIKRNLETIIDFAEISQFIDTPAKHYSSGMYLRLAFAVAAHLEPEILFVDEVLAVGDAGFQKKCLGRMSEISSEGRTVLFVSHNLAAVRQLCDTAILMDCGHCQVKGEVNSVLDRYLATFDEEFSAREEPHVIYDGRGKRDCDAVVTRVEVLGNDGKPKPEVASWEDVVIRVWYDAGHDITPGGVELFVDSLDGTPVIRLSTRPVASFPLTLHQGLHAVDCVLPHLPLSGGVYSVGVGLTMPNISWIWKKRQVGTLVVKPADVFGSGTPLLTDLALLVPRHEWREADLDG
jgi:lipopolysaccharide transport system ATP-binding protein